MTKIKKNMSRYVRTIISDVNGSNPEAPEAKFTPVGKSFSWRLGSRYAGKSFLIPSSSTEKKN